MDPDTLEATKLAVGLAKDLSVQLLTLSSALIGLTVVLAKDVKKLHSRGELVLVIAILITYIVSIGYGIYAIMKLIGSLAPSTGAAVLSVDAARPATKVQIVLFLLATTLFAIYGIIAIIAFRRAAAAAAAAALVAPLPIVPAPAGPAAQKP
jgi:succinate dehydrogenase hydrophobic anchor subunit